MPYLFVVVAVFLVLAVVFDADVAVAAVLADCCYVCFYGDVFMMALNIKFDDAAYFGKRM